MNNALFKEKTNLSNEIHTLSSSMFYLGILYIDTQYIYIIYKRFFNCDKRR